MNEDIHSLNSLACWLRCVVLFTQLFVSFGYGATLSIEERRGVQLYTVKDYRSFQDSPLEELSETGEVYFEDFEDGTLDAPYVTIQRGRIATSDMGIDGIRSVDADDGIIDGMSSGGGVLIPSTPITAFFNFQFAPNLLGEYPSFVGITLTYELPGDIPSDFISVGLTTNPVPGAIVVSLPELYAGSQIPGNVEHAVFLGVYAPEGITRMTINRASQVDHLQYGYVTIPEPSVAVLAVAGIFGLGFLRRRRRVTVTV